VTKQHNGIEATTTLTPAEHRIGLDSGTICWKNHSGMLGQFLPSKVKKPNLVTRWAFVLSLDMVEKENRGIRNHRRPCYFLSVNRYFRNTLTTAEKSSSPRPSATACA
jgi:hypothetical protein